MADDKFLPELSQNLLEILDNDEEYYDITIEVGNDPYVKIFRAHMVILNYRSSCLRKILSTNKKKNDETLVHIKLPSILPEIFQIILRYIYGGRISLEEYDVSDIVKLLVAARELSLQELIPHLQSFLIQNKSTWMEQNFNSVYQISFENNSFTELQKFCTELMSREPEKIFKSPSFTSISENALISLIQNDTFQMNEVQIWEYVLKWGFSQNPELSLDNLKNFSRDDFNVLKNTLQQCIPFIKFDNLTSREFSDKVVPYKKILQKELYDDLLKNFLDNDNKLIKSNIDSKIITNQHTKLISKWIDRLEVTDKIKNSYKFKLILRGSRDGFDIRTFHRICDKQSQTVSIIKVKDSNEILGGYNPIKWDSSLFGRYNTTKDSFIFSLTDGNIQDYVLSRVVGENYAIYNSIDYGPLFGYSDLVIKRGYINRSLLFHPTTLFLETTTIQGYCRKSSHEISIRKTEDVFDIEEYEVFQIVKD